MSTIISRFGRFGLSLAAPLIFSITHAQGGLLDPAFNPASGTNDLVWASARQADGKILIGGSFTTYQGLPTNRLARLNADGSLDATFNTSWGFDNTVQSIVVQPDGNILVGGQFTTYIGKPHKYIVRLTPSGLFDPSFTYLGDYFNAGVAAIALQPDGRIVVGGSFTLYGTTPRNRVARLNANGTLDTTFDPGTGANDLVASVVMSSTGQFYIAGDFTSFNGVPLGRIARLHNNGSLDPAFNSSIGANNSIRTLAIDANGYVTAGGMFTQYNGTAKNRLARVVPNGALDASFTSPNTSTINSTIYTIQVMSNQKLIIGGLFNSGAPKGVLRLLSNGTLDGTFNSGTGVGVGTLYGAVTSFVDPSDRIFIAGRFTSYNGTARNNLARLQGVPLFVPPNDDPERLYRDGVGERSVDNLFTKSGSEGPADWPTIAVAVYPNPNNGTRLKVDLSTLPWSDSPIQISILDLQGRLTLDPWLIPAKNPIRIELDLEGLKNGVYLVRVENADGILASGRLMIEQ